MSTYVEYAIDYIIAKVVNAKVTLGSIFTYENFYQLSDLDDNDLITKRMLLGAVPSGGTNEKDFTTVSNLVINWQTDEFSSGVTYANLFGNSKIRKPTVLELQSDTPHKYSAIDYQFDIQFNDDETLINTVSFDWLVPKTGAIIFQI